MRIQSTAFSLRPSAAKGILARAGKAPRSWIVRTKLLVGFFAFVGLSIQAAPADQALVQADVSLEWTEATDQLQANLTALNEAWSNAKGANGARYATYSIRNANQSLFEFYDRDGVYSTPQEFIDYSHELELRLKPTASIDYEALAANKRVSILIDARAKNDSEIRRLFPAPNLETAFRARDLLRTPSSLLMLLSVTDVDERPTVAAAYQPTANFNRGYLLRIRDTDSPIRIRGDIVFLDPEKQPLFFKPNSEDVEVREFSGLSPSFGSESGRFGNTDIDDNTTAGNDPAANGRIIRASISNSVIVIQPVKGTVDGIRKAEVWLRGWDQRGPTTRTVGFDPATASNLAKLTILVQRGTNRLPHWQGNATGFSIAVDEGFTGSLAPRSGTWQATDPDGDQITYSLLGTSTSGPCASLPSTPGFSFSKACFRLQSTASSLIVISGELDFEAVKADPVARLVLVATDARGGVAEAGINVTVKNINEPISGGFAQDFVSIYLPSTNLKRFDLSSLLIDPEGAETVKYVATSSAPTIASVNPNPNPWLDVTAHKTGQARIRVTATSASSARTSTVTIIVKDTNAAPSFTAGVNAYGVNVLENVLVGSTLPLRIIARDPDQGDVLDFSLEDNPSFVLNRDRIQNKEVRLETKAPLDYETQSRYDLTLTVTDDVASASIEVRVFVSDVDESVRATEAVIDPIGVAVGAVHTLDARPHFIDDAGRVPKFQVHGHDSSIAEILIRVPSEVVIFGRRIGSTRTTLSAADTSGGVAAKSFVINVTRAVTPVQDGGALTERTIGLGLSELTVAELFVGVDKTFSITGATSTAESVLLALTPDDEPDTLVLYALRTGTATVNLSVTDAADNRFTYNFAVTVSTEDDTSTPSDGIQLPDQTVSLGTWQGGQNLHRPFVSDDAGTPSSFSLSSDPEGTVYHVLASADVVAWWHTLDCNEKVIAVGDANPADASNPYCRDFATLSPDHRTAVRAASERYLLLFGLKVGSAEVTVTANYPDDSSKSATFTATVESMSSAAAASVPQRVAYVDETSTLSIADLFHPMPATLYAIPHARDIASIALAPDGKSVAITGLALGSTRVALLGDVATPQAQVAYFSLRVANRPPQASAANLALALELGEAPLAQDLSAVFADAQALRFALLAHDSDVVEAEVVGDELLLEPMRRGVAEIPVRATDPYGAWTDASFKITVTDTQLQHAAELALEDYGLAILNSLSAAVGRRLNEPLTNRDPDRPFSSAAERLRWTGTSSGTDLTAREFSTSSSLVDEGTGLFEPRSDTILTPRLALRLGDAGAKAQWTLWTDADRQFVRRDANRHSLRGATYTRLDAFYLGADIVVNARVQAGVAGSRMTGVGSYAYGSAHRQYQAKQHLVTPYARVQLNNRDAVWALASLGYGELATTAGSATDVLESRDLRTSAIILGATRDIVANHDLNLAWQGDVARMNLVADTAEGDLESLSARIGRVRSGLRASMVVPVNDAITLKPFTSMNLRYDHGHAITERGGGLEWIGGADLAIRSLQVNFQGRAFTTQADSNYREESFSIAATYNPSNSPVGWSLSLKPTWGAARSEFDSFAATAATLHSRADPWLANEGKSKGFGMEGAASYGLRVSRDRFLVIPYVQSTLHGVQDIRFGARLQSASFATRGLDMDFDVRRTAYGPHAVDAGIAVAATMRL